MKRKEPIESDDELDVKGLIDVSDDEEGDTVYHSFENSQEEESDSELNGKDIFQDEVDEADEVDEEQDEEDEEDEKFSDSDSDSELSKLLEEDRAALPQSDSESDLDEPKEFDLNIHTKYSDGRDRIIKPEINPVYDSDDSDGETYNPIGNIPISAYDEMPHIGYDINGKRIMRPAKGSALDQLLETIELPEGWTGLLDKNTGSSLKLTKEELQLINKIQNHENTDDIDPYEPIIAWFTKDEEISPLTAVPEPKRRFVPSKHEAKRIMKIVKAIREGRIVPPEKTKELQQELEPEFDLWEDEVDVPEHIMNLRAPKLPPPTHEQSYNPPEEYLFNKDELENWEKNPEDRTQNFIPQKYSSLRKVPAYQENLRENFERSLDLYLAPRVRHNKLNIDPDSLIPELPSPQDLKPFPIKCSTLYEGHQGRIRAVSVHPTGIWLATGGDDGTVRVWEVLTGRQMWECDVRKSVIGNDDDDDAIECLEWNPDGELGLLAIIISDKIIIATPPIFGFDIENASNLKIETGWGYDTFGQTRQKDLDMNNVDDDEEEEDNTKSAKKNGESGKSGKDVAKWYPPNQEQKVQGITLIIQLNHQLKKLSWHRKGDYFVTVAPDGKYRAVIIHQLSKHLSQSPFRKSKGMVIDCKFHPTKPQLFVAYQRTIKIYDLSQQTLIKKLMPGSRFLSSIDIHPRGDNLVASSYDKRVLWHDLDLSSTPYKTLRYHQKAVRSIVFHKSSYPLFASSSDDGSIHVFHGMVYDDLMTNPLLVPLKKLTGHKVVNSLGVIQLVWHPKEPWLFSVGADGTARLWTT